MRRLRFTTRPLYAVSVLARRGLWLVLATFSVACRDDTPTIRPPVERTADLRAQLELAPFTLSEGVGTEVTVRVLPGGDARPVASFTSQIRYDNTRWQYIDNADAGTALLVVNPGTPGLIRVAGVNTDGFVDGTLVALRFKTIGDGTSTDPVLSFTELHSTDNVDLSHVTIGVPINAGRQ